MEPDQVDRIIEQWNRERPDVDVSAMAIIGRITRLERMIKPLLNRVFAQHDLESWEFDVLATLRRSGPPFQLTAGKLLDSMMITSGTMTNRLDRLAARGLIERAKDPLDARVVLATLTPAGRKRIDAALIDHAANESRIIDGLSETQRQQLTKLLRTLHHAVEADTTTRTETT